MAKSGVKTQLLLQKIRVHPKTKSIKLVPMLEDKLKDIFENVSRWLGFAEGKNAALIAFDSAVAFGLISLRFQENILKSQHIFSCYLDWCILLLGLGVMAALISFLPKTKLPWAFSQDKTDKSDNLIFFGHIAKYSPQKYLISIRETLKPEQVENNKIVIDYAEQIVINSRITVSKFWWFTLGLSLTLAAFLTPIPVVLYWIAYLFIKGKTR